MKSVNSPFTSKMSQLKLVFFVTKYESYIFLRISAQGDVALLHVTHAADGSK